MFITHLWVNRWKSLVNPVYRTSIEPNIDMAHCRLHTVIVEKVMVTELLLLLCEATLGRCPLSSVVELSLGMVYCCPVHTPAMHPLHDHLQDLVYINRSRWQQYGNNRNHKLIIGTQRVMTGAWVVGSSRVPPSQCGLTSPATATSCHVVFHCHYPS